MDKPSPIDERIPIWIALSDFYLDTELTDDTYRHIARKINESPFSLEEVKEIDRTEVFPVLYSNLLSVAGVWGGFQEEWLVSAIQKKKKNRNVFSRFVHYLIYHSMKGMFKECWEQVQVQMQASSSSANSNTN